jgi:hypothetical protein
MNILTFITPGMTDPIDQQIEKTFISKEKFASDIEAYVQKTKLSYMYAIIDYCEENGIELESVNKIMSKVIKEKLRAEATELNFLKKTSHAKPIC